LKELAVELHCVVIVVNVIRASLDDANALERIVRVRQTEVEDLVRLKIDRLIFELHLVTSD
jgi:hypothetical protein